MDFNNRILARDSSVGRSSQVFYREAEGVPFKWEMQPGTPKNPPEDDIIPPLSPSPLMQSLGLPLPNVETHGDIGKDQTSLKKSSKFWSLRKMVLGRRSKQQQSSSFGDFKDISSFSSKSDSFLSFSSNGGRFVEANNSGFEGPFCCSPWNVSAILDEGNTRTYYCSHHKTAFSVEKDATFATRILSRVSSVDQFSGPLKDGITPAGVPFRWEEQPGTPKNPPENELIPPPSPPPAVQSLSLPQPRQHSSDEPDKHPIRRTWARFLLKRNNKKNENRKTEHEISFRKYDTKKMEEVYSSDDEGIGEKSASRSFLSKDGWRVSKIRRSIQGSYFSCGRAWSRSDVFVLVRRKLKSFKS